MNIQLPLVLNDGSVNKTYTRLSTGQSSVVLNAPAEAYTAAKTVRIASTDEKRGGQKVKRQIIEINDGLEDLQTGSSVKVRAYLVLEIPTQTATKNDAVKALKKLLNFFSLTPSGGAAGDYVNSFVNEELP